MDDNKEDKAPLVEIEVDTPRETDEDKDSNTPTWCNTVADAPRNWLCCAYRVRVIGIIALLLLQLPLLAYYYTSSDVIFKFTNSYSNKLLAAIGRSAVNSSQTNSHNDTAYPHYLSTVTRNHSYANAVNLSTTLMIHWNSTSVVSTTNTTTTTLSTILTSTEKRETVATEDDGSILPKCPPEPPGLQGRLPISFDKPPHTFEQTELDNPLLSKGGHAKPPLCIARHKVAIIIPFRDRDEHLQYFLQFMHPTLQRQQIDYQIFIINQLGKGKFNRAKLMNVGFLESLKIYPFECFSFHDVDLIVEDDRSLYWCSDRPRHMSAGVDKFNYVLPYTSIFGGVTLLTKEHMEKINGFSNEFWGWGGEDDDVFNRLQIVGYQIVRYPMEIARYKMIRHKREQGNEPNPERFELIRRTRAHYKTDGLQSIKYKVHSIEYNPTYTNITVDLFGPKW